MTTTLGRHIKACKVVLLLTVVLSILSCSRPHDAALQTLDQKALIVPKEIVNIVIRDYCLTTNERVDFFAVNASIKLERGGIWIDYDRDGIPNTRDNDTDLGINALEADSNFDGYGDLIVYYAGLTVAQQANLWVCSDTTQDTDSDGLNDCEEKVLGTSETNFDTDDDGVPDYIEIRNGMDPVDDNRDPDIDSDGDGIHNLEELRRNTPLHESNNFRMDDYSIIYQNAIVSTSPVQTCYDYTISNIPILEIDNGHLIRMFFLEKDKLDNSKKFLQLKQIIVPKSTGAGSVLEFNYSAL